MNRSMTPKEEMEVIMVGAEIELERIFGPYRLFVKCAQMFMIMERR